MRFGFSVLKALGTVGLASLVVPGVVMSQLPPSGFEVGQPFPEITLPDVRGGRPVALASLRGQPTVVAIFASW